MAGQGKYNDRRYRSLANELKRKTRVENLPCWICGLFIDTDLHWKEPMSFTADHIKPIALGGSLYGELRPAHRACNSRRGKKSSGTPHPIRPPVTSRQW